MKYLFSEQNNSFYPIHLIDDYKNAEIWPTDGVEVDEDIFSLYSGMPPAEKIRGADSQGMPVWVDLPKPPPPTTDALAAIARGYRDAFIIATDSMMVSDYCIDDTLLAEAQRTELLATRAAYRTWPTVENWPLIELPELPQWLLVEAVNQGYRVPVWPPEM